MSKDTLQSIYCDFCREGKGDPLEAALLSAQRNKPIGEILGRWASDGKILNTLHSPRQLLKGWREMLAAGILLALNQYEMPFSISFQYEQLQLRSIWKEHQLLKAYEAMTGYFINKRAARPPHKWVQLPGGSVPLTTGRNWDRSFAASALQHAEITILWALLGYSGFDSSLKKRAKEAVLWHMNLLDSAHLPLFGLFNAEGEATYAELVAANAVLFHAAASLLGMPELEYIADRQLATLKEKAMSGNISLPLHLIAINLWIDSKAPAPESQYISLDSSMHDAATSTVGHRDNNETIVCTLSGGKAGLGAYCCGETGIVSYGPQFQPLGDCKAFGIERSSNSYFGDAEIVYLDKGFRLFGRARMTSPFVSNEGTFPRGLPPAGWVDLVQEFHNESLTIDSSFYALDTSISPAFSFFAKGKRCIVDREQKIRSRSLDRYIGSVHSVSIEGSGSAFNITSLSGRGEMQVIPLAGGDHFWGADFLISYIIDPGAFRNTWHVIPSR